MPRVRSSPATRAVAYIALALLTVALVSLHSFHFRDQEYRQDEVVLVHQGIERPLSESALITASDNHPPLHPLMINAWVKAFGDRESIVRFNSALWMALALAAVYRLGVDLFGAKAGLLAVFLFGTLSAVMFYGHEVRPYAMLAFTATATQLTYLRWLRKPTFARAMLFVTAGILALYSHYYNVYVLAGLVAFTLAAARWNRRLYLQAFGLFAAIGLSFLGWILPFLHAVLVTTQGASTFAFVTIDGWALNVLHNQLQLRPYALGQFLFVAGVLLPIKLGGSSTDRTRFRFSPGWRKVFVILVPLVIVLIAFVLNQAVRNVTPRNLIVLLPSLATLMAFALASLPWQAIMALGALVIIPAVTDFEIYVVNGPFFDLLAFMSNDRSDSRVVVDAAGSYSHHQTLAYYLRERGIHRKPNEALFHLMPPVRREFLSVFPAPPAHLTMEASEETLDAFRAFLDGVEQVWYVAVDEGTDYNAPFLAILNRDYVAYRTASFGEDEGEPEHTIVEYRRRPETLTDIYLLGDDVHLLSWRLLDDVEASACETITLESWWQADDAPTDNYSMTLTLANADGMGVARTDSAPAGLLTQQWEPGRLYLDIRDLTIPCDTPPGEYPLLTGWYDFDNPANALTVSTPDGAAQGGLGYLTTLTVR